MAASASPLADHVPFSVSHACRIPLHVITLCLRSSCTIEVVCLDGTLRVEGRGKAGQHGGKGWAEHDVVNEQGCAGRCREEAFPLLSPFHAMQRP